MQKFNIKTTKNNKLSQIKKKRNFTYFYTKLHLHLDYNEV